MSLEGNLRELELSEVCQLLAQSRKCGVLGIHAQLEGRTAEVVFDRGAIVDAMVGVRGSQGTTARQVEDAALELLTWRDGSFAFTPDALASAQRARETGVRLATASVLVEGARQIEGWLRLADRIPHARVVPAFVRIDPQELPSLHLQPQQWEVLTRVDGQRDLPALAHVLTRDLLEVAGIVHGLIGTGLLTLVDVVRSTRHLPTPPATPLVASSPESSQVSAQHTPAPNADLWVPEGTDNPMALMINAEESDVIFDPVRVGVTTPDGLPRLRTPLGLPAVGAANVDGFDDRQRGDQAARRGDFSQALTCWNAYVQANESGEDADDVREAMALAARLHALIYAVRRQ